MTKSDSLPPRPESYIADIVRSDGRWSRVYRDRGQMRVELYNGETCTQIFIWLDTGSGYTLTPASRTYTSHFQPGANLASLAGQASPLSWRLTGQEAIEGTLCSRYEGSLPAELDQPINVTYVDNSTHLTRRSYSMNRIGEIALTVEWRNVVVGPSPPDVFAIPTDYQQARQ